MDYSNDRVSRARKLDLEEVRREDRQGNAEFRHSTAAPQHPDLSDNEGC